MANTLDKTYTFQIIALESGDAGIAEDTCPGGVWGDDCGKKYPGGLLYELLPQVFRDEDANLNTPLQAMFEALDQIFAQSYESVASFPCIVDPDACPEKYLDYILRTLGNPFEYATNTLNCSQKRKVVKALVLLYKYKGTLVGIEYALNILLGVRSKATSYWKDSWHLGETKIGEEFFTLAPPSTPWILNRYKLGKETRIRSNIARREIYTVEIKIDGRIVNNSYPGFPKEYSEYIEKIVDYMKPFDDHRRIFFTLGAKDVPIETFEDFFNMQNPNEYVITSTEDYVSYV